ncbi:MAG TPA: WD40 repeat domain-containing protein [Lacunisphaera sp.]|nr:WD40 repeat domain-containing protein [Lacunisphaera sp.]
MQFAKHWAAALDDYAIDLAWSPDGSWLAAASAAGGIMIYDATNGTVRHQLAGHEDGANCLAWRPNVAGVADPGAGARPGSATPAAILATGGQDGNVRFWDGTTGAQTAEIKLGNAWVEHLAWQAVRRTEDGGPKTETLLFAAAGKKLVALRADGTVAHTFPDAPKTISALAASPVAGIGEPGPGSASPATSSPAVAAACFGHVVIWDATTFTAQKEFPYGNAIYALTWSPDGRWLVAGCHDNAVHLWAPAEENMELHMSGYETRLKELSFSPDSKWLATGGGRDSCVWDCSGAGPEGREPLMLPHNGRVCALAFQHRQGLLASGSTNGEFTLWMPTRKNPMVAEVTMPAAATKFAWRGDDGLLAVGTEKGNVFVFKTG